MTSESERSRSRSRSRRRSNSAGSSPDRPKKYRRSRSESRSPSSSPSRDRKHKKSHKKSSRRHSRSRSRNRSRSRTYSPLPRRGSAAPPPPPGYGRRYRDGREKPDPCRCLGIFGMSLHTREKDLEQIFGEFGSVEQVQIVRDRISGRSRGFGFVYFGSTKHAAKAKEEMTDAVIDGMKVRVDFSVTNKPSTGFSGRERDGSRQRTSPVY